MADVPNDLIDPGPDPSSAPPALPNDLIDPGGTAPPTGEDASLANAISSGVMRGTPGGRAIGAGIGTAASLADRYLGPQWGPGARIQAQPGESIADIYNRNYQLGGQEIEAGKAAYPKTSFAASLVPSAIMPLRSGAGMLGYGAGVGLNQADTLADAPREAAMGAGASYLGGKLAQGVASTLLPFGAASRDAAIDAANRLGITIPRFAASSSPLVQRAGQFAQSVPIASAPVTAAAHESIAGLGEAAEDAAGGATIPSAGSAIRAGVKNWIGPVSKADVDARYQAVSQAMNPNTLTPLTATSGVAQQIAQTRSAAAMGDSPAVNLVSDALNRPNGLTFNGIKTLRSSIGEMLDGGQLPAGMSQAELKQVYGSLSADLERSAYNSGGQQGVAAFQRANQFAAGVNQRREALVGLLGGNPGTASSEGVYSAIQRAAGPKGNLDLLNQAKQSVLPTDWDELARGTVGQMGRDLDGNFSPARFLSDYGRISDGAKDTLFGASGQSGPAGAIRQNLDDIQAVSRQWAKLKGYANPSGTGHTVAGVAALEAAPEAVNHPIAAVASLLGANTVGKWLASPAGSGAASNWMKANMAWAVRPSPAAMNMIRSAAANVASTASAQFGAKLDPMALAAMALHEREGAEPDPGTTSGTMP
jgi:hypothetical protein